MSSQHVYLTAGVDDTRGLTHIPASCVIDAIDRVSGDRVEFLETPGTDRHGEPDDAEYELEDEFRVNPEVGRELLSETAFDGVAACADDDEEEQPSTAAGSLQVSTPGELLYPGVTARTSEPAQAASSSSRAPDQSIPNSILLPGPSAVNALVEDPIHGWDLVKDMIKKEREPGK